MTANLEREKRATTQTAQAPMDLVTAERLSLASADIVGVCGIALEESFAITVLLNESAAARFVGAGAVGIGVELPYLPVIDRESSHGLALLVQVPRAEIENYCLMLSLGEGADNPARRYRVDLASFC